LDRKPLFTVFRYRNFYSISFGCAFTSGGNINDLYFRTRHVSAPRLSLAHIARLLLVQIPHRRAWQASLLETSPEQSRHFAEPCGSKRPATRRRPQPTQCAILRLKYPVGCPRRKKCTERAPATPLGGRKPNGPVRRNPHAGFPMEPCSPDRAAG